MLLILFFNIQFARKDIKNVQDRMKNRMNVQHRTFNIEHRMKDRMNVQDPIMNDTPWVGTSFACVIFLGLHSPAIA